MYSPTDMSENEAKEAILRLSHFDPTFVDEYGNQVIDYLVLDALASYGPLIVVTASEVRECIKSRFLLDFADEEINASAKRLAQTNMVNPIEVPRGEKLRFQILSEAASRIQHNLAEIKDLEEEVLNGWKEELSQKYAEYPVVKDRIELIAANLQAFMSQMFSRHGIECVAILYPESPKTREWLDFIGTDILDSLPSIDPFVDEIVKLETPNFFRNADPKRMAYITNLLNSSFMWHLIQVDERCSRLLQTVTDGQQLYLDNNILYSLVGFDGQNMLSATHTMLNWATRLGYQLGVTNKTVDEFRGSLDWHMKELKQKPPIPRELARIAADNLENDSFISCYWDEFARNGITIEEFVFEKSHLEDVLEGLGINQTNEFRQDIEESQQLQNEESILRSSTGKTEAHIVTHDAFHRLFIDKLRNGPKYNFSEAVAWFLTNDCQLPVYDKAARKGKPCLPFCITGDQWVQVNRPLLMRTTNQADYYQSLYALLARPFLRTMFAASTMERAYGEVLGRLGRYKEMNPQLALSITADKHFMVTVASETNEQKKEEAIDNAIVDLATELQRDKESLAKSIEKKDLNLKELEERLGAVEAEIRDRETQYKKQNEEVSKELHGEKTQRESARTKQAKTPVPFLDAISPISAPPLWIGHG